MNPDALDERLQEWARWVRAFGHRRRNAQSAEGAYRSPQHWEAITSAPGIPCNPDRAAETERAVIALKNPWTLVLVGSLVLKWREDQLRRRLKKWRLQPTTALVEARARVAARLGV